MARDGNSRSILNMAISSNSKHMFEAVLVVLEELLAEDEVCTSREAELTYRTYLLEGVVVISSPAVNSTGSNLLRTIGRIMSSREELQIRNVKSFLHVFDHHNTGEGTDNSSGCRWPKNSSLGSCHREQGCA